MAEFTVAARDTEVKGGVRRLARCPGRELATPSMEEDAEDEDDARVRSGCATHGGFDRLGCSDASAATPILSAANLVQDMRWRRFGTGAERVRSGEHDTQQVASIQPWIDDSIVGGSRRDAEV
jgi:hypothetical protein